MMTDHGGGIQIVYARGELDLAAAGSLAARGCAALARRARLLRPGLTGPSFCHAHGLSALVKIANHAGKTGCRYGLLGPRPPGGEPAADHRP
jgi:hypothetical protein